jgi:predicted dehydrogenase
MTAPSLRFGLLSFAHGHAYSYADCIRRLDGVHLVGIWDDDPTRAEQAAKRVAAPRYKSVDALLDEALDGVIICAENAHHRALVEKAAGRVPAILCEKPIATTIEDAHAMIDVCARTNTRLQVAFPVRFSPPILALKEALDRSEFGQVYAVSCTNHGSMPGRWFVDPQLSGGGAVMDHTVHVVDLLRWFWSTEIVEIYAEVGVGLLHPDLAIDDAGMISFRLANGVYGTLDTSWSRPKAYPTWGDVKIELVGEKGGASLDAFRQHLHVASEAAGGTHWHHWGTNMDFGLIRDFAEMIRNNRQPSITGLDGLRALEAALAAYRSAELGTFVRLPLT